MTIEGIKDLTGIWVFGLQGLWATFTQTTYSILQSIFGDTIDVIFDAINTVFPGFVSYLQNNSLLMFMLTAGLAFYIAWTIATWLLNIVT